MPTLAWVCHQLIAIGDDKKLPLAALDVNNNQRGGYR
jgi:hypothetical protein